MDVASHPSTSLDNLEAMLAAGKLSQHDYDILRAAMEPRSGKRARPESVIGGRACLRKSWANRQLGGVCAGLAEWMGIEPRSIRNVFIITALMTGGAASAVYLVLYAAIPWKESERDQVSRFSYLFAGAAFGLWLALQGLIYVTARPAARVFSHSTIELPAISRMAFKLGEYQGIGIAIQACLLLATVLMYNMIPVSSRLRKLVAGVILCGVLLVFLIVILGSVAAVRQLGANMPP